MLVLGVVDEMSASSLGVWKERPHAERCVLRTKRRRYGTPPLSQQEAFPMMTEETEFRKAQQQFQDLCELMRQAGREGWRMDEIEGRAMPKLMRLGLELLAGHMERAGTGDAGPEVAYDTGDGKGVVMRRPLAEELREAREGTPMSAPVPVAVPAPVPVVSPAPASSGRRKRGPRPATRRAGKARQRRAQEVVRKHHERLPAAARTEDQKKKKKDGKKQMAYVGAVYTIDRFPRTTDQVLEEMARQERS